MRDEAARGRGAQPSGRPQEPDPGRGRRGATKLLAAGAPNPVAGPNSQLQAENTDQWVPARAGLPGARAQIPKASAGGWYP